jgi:HNH endonuclease
LPSFTRPSPAATVRAGVVILVPFTRIDDGFDDHPKVLALLDRDDGAAALGLWTLGLAWARKNRLRGQPRGFIPRDVTERFAGAAVQRRAAVLVDVELWRPHAGGWLVCDDRELFRWGAGPGAAAWIPRRVREAVFARDNHACVLCGTPEDLTIDHVYPRLLGGDDCDGNLQTLCRSHNSSKGART